MFDPKQPDDSPQRLPTGTPGPSGQREDGVSQQAASDGRPSMPAISLPKGGGAIKGMGEKFTVNPATGTGTLTVPLASSPGRAGFGPQLTLTSSRKFQIWSI